MIKTSKVVCSVLLAVTVAAGMFSGCDRNEKSQSLETEDIPASEMTIDVPEAEKGPLGREAADGKISLRLWESEADRELLTEQCGRFIDKMSEYAEIEIEVAVRDEDDIALQVMKDSSSAADVFCFSCGSLNRLVNSGAVEELSESDREFVVFENSEASVRTATVGGKIYAFPETGESSCCLVYDKTVVSQEQSKTLEGVLKACKDKNKKFVMDVRESDVSCMFLFTGGVIPDGFESDGETQSFEQYNMKTAVKSILAFRELFKKYQDTFLNAESTKMIDGFRSGTVGAGIDSSRNFDRSREALGEKSGFAVLPTITVDGADSQIINMYGYKLMGVNAASKYPKTSFELARFLSSEECRLERAEMLGWEPSNKNASENGFVKDDESLGAVLSQQEFSVPQTLVSDMFAAPSVDLGKNIIDFQKDIDEKKCEELIGKTIEKIRE